MIPLYFAAFFQNTGMTVVLVGVIFYVTHRFHASYFELGALAGIGAFVFFAGAALSRYWSRRFSPKRLTLIGTALFILVAFSYPFLPNLFSFFWVYPLGSVGLSLFWPSLENWISLGSTPFDLKRHVGNFNLSWSPGQILAPFLAGVLFEWNPFFPFWFGVLFFIPVFFFLSVSAVSLPQDRKEATTSPSRVPPSSFLIVCWLSNFTGWFISAIFRSFFPKYGSTLGLTPTHIGSLLLMIGVGQVLFFYLLSRLEGWEESSRFLFFWEGVAILSLLSIAWIRLPLLWVFSFFLFGCFSGVAYAASLLVSLKERGLQGGGTSSHEALVGLGICLGPILGGISGEFFGIQAPYVTGAAILTLVTYFQGRLLRRVV